MPRKVQTGQMSVHLQKPEQELVRRIAAYFPDGAVSINRVARLCVRAGAPLVEAEMQEKARQYAAAGQLVPDKDPTP